jgi:hypothetical protein
LKPISACSKKEQKYINKNFPVAIFHGHKSLQLLHPPVGVDAKHS